MRALELERCEGPEALRLVEAAEPLADGGVLLELHAIGINFPDLLATQGRYQHKPPLPFIPGCEMAGVVRSAPAGSEWQAGDRAAAFVWQGGYAEVAAVPLNALVPAAHDTPFITAAAMVVNYQTVHFGLARRGQVQAGESVLVLGAGGGIGTAAVQVAKGLGARVIAGVANEARASTATAAGADEVLVLAEGFARQVRQRTDGRGVNAVLDPLGDWIFDEALRALAPEGRILIVGFAAGGIPQLKVNRLLMRNVSAVGVAYGAFLDLDANLMRDTGAALAEMLARGVVDPHIGAHYQFEEIPAALIALSRGEIPGKGVAEVVPDTATSAKSPA
jgi:NADPH2:quinone reductase